MNKTERPWKPVDKTDVPFNLKSSGRSPNPGWLQSDKIPLEDYYQIIFETSPIGIALTDWKGVFQHCNPAYCELLGYSQDELRQLAFGSLVYEPDRNENLELVTRLLALEIERFEVINRYVTKSGKLVWVRKFIKVIRGSDGKPVGTIAQVTDLTKIKKYETELQALLAQVTDSEKKFSTVFRTSPVALALSTVDGVILEVNEAFSKLFGRSHVNPELQKNLLERLKLNGAVENYQCQCQSDSGVQLSVSISVNLINVNQRKLILMTIVDQTEQKKIEADLLSARQKAEEAERMKSRFLANMSHEIRTPLTVILGFAEVISLGRSSPEKNFEYCQRIHHSAEHLKHLLDDILDLSKIDAKKMQAEIVGVRLQEFLDEELSHFKSLAAEKGLFLESNLKSLPEKVFTDPTRLRQIIINVVANAIKYTSQGGIRITGKFLSHTKSTSGNLVEIEVKDTGIGLSTDQQNKVFDEFMQADLSTPRKYGGTGLGLVISKRLSQLLGGDLCLRSSQLGVGSCFVISFDPGGAIERPSLSIF